MRQRGTVKSYDPGAGIGFIENSQGEEFFVHRSGLLCGCLEPRQEVEFEQLEPGRATAVFLFSSKIAKAAKA